MDDSISRQAAIDAFKKELTVGESEGNYVTICSAIGYKGAKQILESLPSVTPERKTGRWIDPTHENGMIYDKKAYAECSVCGEKEYLGRGKKYCPNCGSYMRGEEHDS